MIGTTLGPYRILEQIDLGGMATVYKAYQPGMDRLVALKVLPPHYAQQPKLVQRFEQEARVIANLEHRNILPVFDFGEQDGATFLAMRYLQAGTVKDILAAAKSPLPLPDAAKVVFDIAAALDYAHSQGVIHRDVKPSNILVDRDGHAYLMDLGIAKVLEGTVDLTGSTVLGTPAYMAPDQTLGKAATPQTDVYALGAMLYELLTGRQPYAADTPLAVALMHVHEPLPLPRAINPDIPEVVELVILKALAKEPGDRYASAGELARALNAAVEAGAYGSPTRLVELAQVAADSKSGEEVTYDIRAEFRRQERTAKWKRLLRGASYVGIAVALIALVGVVVWLVGQVQQGQTTAQETATALGLAEQSAMQTGQAATQTASRPTDTPSPTGTLDLFAAATMQRAATQTHSIIAAVTQAIRLTHARETLSAEETIIALTPTDTPTITPTPTITFTPRPTFTPTPITTYVQIEPGHCIPDSVRDGLIVFYIGAGVAGRENAIASLGNTAAVITVNGQPTTPLSASPQGIALTSEGRTVEVQAHLGYPQPDWWGYETYAQIILDPGEYDVRGDWLDAYGSTNHSKACRLIVTE